MSERNMEGKKFPIELSAHARQDKLEFYLLGYPFIVMFMVGVVPVSSASGWRWLQRKVLSESWQTSWGAWQLL